MRGARGSRQCIDLRGESTHRRTTPNEAALGVRFTAGQYARERLGGGCSRLESLPPEMFQHIVNLLSKAEQICLAMYVLFRQVGFECLISNLRVLH
jgi:hypothetical protein